MIAETERRSADLELRAASGRRLVGYAATWDTVATIGAFSESIRKGAFAASLAAGADIVALVDHDPAKLLARTRNGSLTLAEDDTGLAFTIAVPRTTLGDDVLALAEARSLGGMSFGFNVPAGGDEWRGDHRTLTNVRLAEVSIVSSWPAYSRTSVAARSLRRAAGSAAVRQMIMGTL
jgi:HK97 family phage prohead protease